MDKLLGKTLVLLAAILVLSAGCKPEPARPSKPSERQLPPVAFKPKEMADALHSVVAADREIYIREVVEKNKDRSMPVPAHLLRSASQKIQQKGAEFHYVLRSLTPISSRNSPETPVEKAGLEAVARDPETNFYSEESLGGRRYLTAVYADRAIVGSCVECHNAHPESPKKDYKQGDVMGAIVLRVPLEF